jgi:hypothetical protein
MEPFVCVNLFGGLGNQIFQYAAAKAVAKASGCSSIVVNKESENAHNVHGHNYALELFQDAREVDWPRGPLGEWLFKSQGVNVLSQQDGFAPWDPSSLSPPCVLNGYFQYLPSLVHVIPQVCDVLRKNGPSYPDQDAVFLHIRRGDYVQKSDFHFLQGQDYYEQAIQLLKPTKVLIFSDDIAWCKEQSWLQTLPSREFIDEPDEIKSFFQMAACKQGAILANSTFSWWAAMVSGTRNVVYPSRWVNQQIYSLFPSHWKSV